MTAYICTTCGTQFAPSERPPAQCLICEEYRQFLPSSGQSWTDLGRLSRQHALALRAEGELLGLSMSPQFGITQRALLVRTPAGNILWDCFSLINPVVVDVINGLGGLAGIAISHPHYYTTMVEWSRAFGGIPVHLHAADREWIMRPDPALVLWEGETKEILPGLTLVRCGGHYEGGTILHWAQGAGGKGALLAGDILQVVADRKFLGFMRSYPNFIPLGATVVRRIADRVAPWSYDAIYGAFWDRVIPGNATAAMAASVARHLHWLEHDPEQP